MLGAWLLLIAAIVIEVAATSFLPKSQGFRHIGWSAVVMGGYTVSIWMLTVVINHIPVSVTYAVWSGLGTAGIAVIGMLYLDEDLDLVKAIALLMIIGGVVILNLNSPH